jgi:bilirubin oxidase
MNKYLFVIFLTLTVHADSQAQNPLLIPDTLRGTSFSLNVYDTSTVFYPGFTTNTMGVNTNYLGPTLILNKGDSVSISVHNHLMDTTTIHWHGMHVSAMNDGGPHIIIPPGTSWNPSFVVRDHASTYWYHPHLHMMTNLHATLGAAGIIIVNDSTESALNLPRTYGIDDFPFVLQTKCFDNTKQIQIDNPYDSVMMVNGTLDPFLQVPAQVIRLRLLNASSERVFNVGFQGNLTFYQIGSDGGLLDAPVPLTRLMISNGERAEILLDLSGMNGQIISMLSYASELPNGIYGAGQPGLGAGQVIPGYTLNALNGADFNIISLQIGPPNSSAVTSIPVSLTTNTPYPSGSASITNTLTFTPVNMGPTAIQGPFQINNQSFDMEFINYSIPLNDVQIWTLLNLTPIAHPFHIHDVQFYILDINGISPPPHMQGRKDVVLVPPQQSVSFITKFETFCDSMMPYMYHCHMLPHEDDGMMGQFVVTCPVNTSVNPLDDETTFMEIFPNPSGGEFILNTGNNTRKTVRVYNPPGKLIYQFDSSEKIINFSLQEQEAGIYYVQVNGADKQQTIRVSKY